MPFHLSHLSQKWSHPLNLIILSPFFIRILLISPEEILSLFFLLSILGPLLQFVRPSPLTLITVLNSLLAFLSPALPPLNSSSTSYPLICPQTSSLFKFPGHLFILISHGSLPSFPLTKLKTCPSVQECSFLPWFSNTWVGAYLSPSGLRSQGFLWTGFFFFFFFTSRNGHATLPLLNNCFGSFWAVIQSWVHICRVCHILEIKTCMYLRIVARTQCEVSIRCSARLLNGRTKLTTGYISVLPVTRSKLSHLKQLLAGLSFFF